jgi:hypothetical protein
MTLKSKLFVAAGFAIGIGLIPSAASAGTPAVQACVGKSLSALATTQAGPGAFGQGVRGFAQDPETAHPGLGDGILALQAGFVGDEAVPNTCNDDN